MKYSIFFIILFFINNSVQSADFFTLCDTEEKQFIKHVRILPEEIQKRIYFMAIDNLKKYNTESMKAYVHGLKISKLGQNYTVKYYFSFKDYGYKCTSIIAFYSKNNMQTRLTEWGNEVVESFASILIHTLQKDGKINTTNDIRKNTSMSPSALATHYNGIALNHRQPGTLRWFVSWRCVMYNEPTSTCTML